MVGAVLWLGTRRISFGEWAKGAVLGFLIAGAFHVYAIASVLADIEMLSGQITHVTYHPPWQAEPSGEGNEYDDGTRPEAWSATGLV